MNGKAIADNGGSADAYVKPALFTLLTETPIKDNGLYHMNAAPFTLDITTPYTKLVSGYSGSLEFSAVTKQLGFDYFDQDHKIVIQLDSGGEILTQKEYGLNGAEGSSFTTTNTKYRIDGISTSLSTNYLTMKVYLKYKGEMKLIGSQGVGVSFEKS
ncbi:hypothetical protein PaeBR_06520 [Paenibacillus sp. BR2-3]|uniref:hypothetical protein n=1 Tax=Paenibacillus sp. BR2-3 TaxID=3048494 RepID=UPI00397788EE